MTTEQKNEMIKAVKLLQAMKYYGVSYKIVNRLLKQAVADGSAIGFEESSPYSLYADKVWIDDVFIPLKFVSDDVAKTMVTNYEIFSTVAITPKLEWSELSEDDKTFITDFLSNDKELKRYVDYIVED